MNEELTLQLLEDSDFVLQIGDDEGDEMYLDLGGESEPAPTYDGDYEVTPRLDDEQILQTKNKLMARNVTVHPIPVVITTNPYNGNTVVIG